MQRRDFLKRTAAGSIGVALSPSWRRALSSLGSAETGRSPALAVNALAAGFRNVPETRPFTYWMWMNNHHHFGSCSRAPLGLSTSGCGLEPRPTTFPKFIYDRAFVLCVPQSMPGYMSLSVYWFSCQKRSSGTNSPIRM